MHWGSKLNLGFFVFLCLFCFVVVHLFLCSLIFLCCRFFIIHLNFSCLVYTGILSFYLHCFCFDLYLSISITHRYTVIILQNSHKMIIFLVKKKSFNYNILLTVTLLPLNTKRSISNSLLMVLKIVICLKRVHIHQHCFKHCVELSL